jgi:hypothetical protein
LEIALLDGWMRFWFRGGLVPLTPDLQRGLEEWRQRAEQERQRADQAEQRAEQLQQELNRLRAQLEQAGNRPPESS